MADEGEGGAGGGAGGKGAGGRAAAGAAGGAAGGKSRRSRADGRPGPRKVAAAKPAAKSAVKPEDAKAEDVKAGVAKAGVAKAEVPAESAGGARSVRPAAAPPSARAGRAASARPAAAKAAGTTVARPQAAKAVTEKPEAMKPEAAKAEKGAGSGAAAKKAAAKPARAPASRKATAPAAAGTAAGAAGKEARAGAAGQKARAAAAGEEERAGDVPAGKLSAREAVEQLLDTRGEAATPEEAKKPATRGPAEKPRRINLALQGGGAHGAFTWGVLDRLLAEPSIEIAAISGCSAGALNAAAVKAGMVAGGREGAREALDWLWGQMGAIPDLSFTHWLMSFLPGPALTAKIIEAMMPIRVMDAMTNAFSPYDIPFLDNPLRRVVEQFSFDNICAEAGPAIYISATNVRTGKIRVFSDGEISTGAILASACLPMLFRAEELPDPETGTIEAYWDGGYSGNPALFPLFEPELPDDIVIVNINPMRREEVPRSAQEIENRVNEISFNASLLRELRAIAFVKRLISNGQVRRGAMKDVLVHMISDDDLMQSLSIATKLMPAPTLLNQLFEAGRGAAARFLEGNGARIGKESSIDIVAMLG